MSKASPKALKPDRCVVQFQGGPLDGKEVVGYWRALSMMCLTCDLLSLDPMRYQYVRKSFYTMPRGSAYAALFCLSWCDG